MKNVSGNSYRSGCPPLVPVWLSLAALIIGVSLAGCAPHGYAVQQRPVTSAPLPSTVVYFYPTKGQSEAQQERDRYECYLWAVKQTGFDPGQAQLAPHQRVEVTPVAPPGADAAAGAVGGAIVGSMMSPRHDRGFGMVFGAITGAMLGAASDAARQQQAQQVQQHYDTKEAARYARLEKQSRDYQRALTAC
ncbi:MAG: glycine zipper 2TM domain-containing protein, partial [Gammaproteobacteria bacterium]